MNLENHKARSRRGLLKAAGAAAGAGLGVGSVVDEVASVEGSEAGEELWSFDTGGNVRTGPVVVDDSVYVVSHNRCFALDAVSGEERWRFEDGSVGASPIVVDNTVFFGGRYGLYAVDAEDGELHWNRDRDGNERVWATPDFKDSTLYPAIQLKGATVVFGLDAVSSEEEWFFTGPSGWTSSSPLVVEDSLYYGSHGGWLAEINLSDIGTDQHDDRAQSSWRTDIGGYLYTPTYHEGVLYVATTDEALYAVDADTGDPIWSYTTDDSIQMCPTVYDDIVYVASQYGKVYAVDTEDGELFWSQETGSSMEFSSPTVAGDKVYIGSWDNKLLTFDRETGEPRWTYQTNDSVISSPTVKDGVVYFGSHDGHMYAVNAGVQGSSVDTRVEQGRHGHHHVYHEERSTGELDFEEGLPGFGLLTAAGAAVAGGAWLKYRNRSEK